jgi:hypothetical protein
MKRFVGILTVGLAVVLFVVVQTSISQEKAEKLSKQQLLSLISTAKTPAEHLRIAKYYQEKAQDYLAQAKEHEQMLAAYKANPSLSNDKNRASTIGHCEYFVQTFKDLAAKSQELAQLHEEMAKDAEKK